VSETIGVSSVFNENRTDTNYLVPYLVPGAARPSSSRMITPRIPANNGQAREPICLEKSEKRGVQAARNGPSPPPTPAGGRWPARRSACSARFSCTGMVNDAERKSPLRGLVSPAFGYGLSPTSDGVLHSFYPLRREIMQNPAEQSHGARFNLFDAMDLWLSSSRFWMDQASVGNGQLPSSLLVLTPKSLWIGVREAGLQSGFR
jgi:hypothetical protein